MIRMGKFETTLGDEYLVMEGDSGGVAYLVCPRSIVRCPESVLRILLGDLTRILGDELESSDLYYASYTKGEKVDSGSAGHEGRALNVLWINEWLHELGLYEKIRAVITGERAALDLTPEELHSIETWRQEKIENFKSRLGKHNKTVR